MRRTSFADDACPIARGADAIGDIWSLLILRDAFDGYTRFDEFQSGLGIAPNMLSRRLSALTETGLLERRRYQDHPPRDEYLLTEQGRASRAVVLTLFGWVNERTAPPDRTMLLVDRQTGAEVRPILVDQISGRRIADLEVIFTPGPAAGEDLRQKLAGVPARLNGFHS